MESRAAGQTDLIRSLTANSVMLSIDIMFRGATLLQDASDVEGRDAAIVRHDGSRGCLRWCYCPVSTRPALPKSTVGRLLCGEHMKWGVRLIVEAIGRTLS